MPSRSHETRCTCIQCTRVGGLDSSGNPKGVVIPSRNLAAHLARVRAEAVEIATRDVDEAEARLFALTLTDDGPNRAGQPSKLWTSRAEFQQEVYQTHNLPDHPSPPVNDILEGVSRLSLAQGVPLSDHPEAVHAASVAPPPAEVVHTTPAPMPPSVRLSSQERHRVQKKETNHRTTKALRILNQVEIEIGVCKVKLTGTPTHHALIEVETALGLLHPAVEKVKRRTPSIDSRKLQITEQLASLEARLAELKSTLPPSPEPIIYHSGG